jgi:small redox-active disulfide protein 2
MKKLQILGSGCMKCNKLAQAAESAAREMGLEYEIEKVSDMQKIISFGVMATPALVVDGIVKVSGRVPAPEEMKTLLA